MRRALLALLLLGALAPALAAGPARAAAIGQCSATRGSIVAVDFAHFGGPLVRGCGVTAAGGPEATGLALLEDGGFTAVGTSQYGLAFVCRLGDAAFAGGAAYPTAAQAPCTRTPPADASWSYWLAGPGATSWTYSPRGLTDDRPVAGEVELWTFGPAAPASGLVAELRATNTTAAAPTTAPTTAQPATAPPTHTPAAHAPRTAAATAAPTRSTAPAGSAASPPATGAAAAPSASGRTAPSPGGPTSSGPAAVRGTAGSPSPQALVDSVAAPAPHHAGGSPLPAVLAAVLVALLAGGAGVAARQRRRGGP